MLRIFTLAICGILFSATLVQAQATYNLQTTNFVLGSSTITFDVQIQASSGSFSLGGGTGRRDPQTYISLIHTNYSSTLTNPGEMNYNSFSFGPDIASNYGGGGTGGDNGSGEGYIEIELKQSSTATTITTAWKTLGTVTMNIASGTTNANSTTIDFDLVEVFDNSNTLLNQGTLTSTSTNNVPLPVELSSFTLNKKENSQELNWSTASELNNQGFEVQRSNDGMNFYLLGWIDGNGTSNNTHNYSFEDYEAIIGVAYYRLKQLDYDGSFEYSEVINTAVSSTIPKSLLTAFPNPASTTLNIQSISNYKVVNMQGRTIFASSNNAQNLDISAWPKGMYLIQTVDSQSNSIENFKLFVR